MDAERIEKLKAHVAASNAENVTLAASDFCALVTDSKIDDAGLQKAAKSMVKHVGLLAINRQKAAEMLVAISGQRSAASGQTGSTGKASGTPASTGKS